MMKRWIAIGFTIATTTNLWAQAPEMFRYQGRLVNDTNLVNATLPINFRLYDAKSSGNLLYEDSNSVLVVDGFYSTFIGDDTVYGSLANAMTNTAVYLELTVNGETLLPRERLVSVPYSLNTTGAELSRIAELESQTNKWNTAYSAAINNSAALAQKTDLTGANLTNLVIIPSTAYFTISGASGGNTNLNKTFTDHGMVNNKPSYLWAGDSDYVYVYWNGNDAWVYDCFSANLSGAHISTNDTYHPWDAIFETDKGTPTQGTEVVPAASALWDNLGGNAKIAIVQDSLMGKADKNGLNIIETFSYLNTNECVVVHDDSRLTPATNRYFYTEMQFGSPVFSTSTYSSPSYGQLKRTSTNVWGFFITDGDGEWLIEETTNSAFFPWDATWSLIDILSTTNTERVPTEIMLKTDYANALSPLPDANAKWLVLGDSMSDSNMVNTVSGLSKVYSQHLQAKFPTMQVKNRAISGSTASAMNFELECERDSGFFTSNSFEITSIYLGANDINSGVVAAYSNITSLASNSVFYGSDAVVLISNFGWSHATPEVRTDLNLLNNMLRGYAYSNQLVFCDVAKVLNKFGSVNSNLKYEINDPGNPMDKHLNDAGHNIIARMLIGKINEGLIPELKAP